MQDKTINIGISCHLQRLIETCALVQASRGGGKSYLVRKMDEEISGHCQQIIIDLEGEFVSLREKFPFALLSVEGGDIPLNIRHAGTYARKFMESNMSVIIDLSDLMPADRILFVRDFCHALMNLPKHLYHPLLVYIDEAHVFCPQDESAISYASIIDMAARGRKRDIGLVLSTQRVSKLHKDVTAELLNKVIGRTGQDIDQARAAKELDWKQSDKTLLRKLEPGDFYCFGPAFQEETVKFHVAPVATSHKKTGSMGTVTPPTPDAIKAMLQSLQDLPEEAERELETNEQLRNEVTRLTAQLKKGIISRPDNSEEIGRLKGEINTRDEVINSMTIVIDRLESILSEIKDLADKHAISIPGTFQSQAMRSGPEHPFEPAIVGDTLGLYATIKSSMPRHAPGSSAPTLLDNEIEAVEAEKMRLDQQLRTPRVKSLSPGLQSGVSPIGKCARAILHFLASHNREFSKAQISVATGYSATSSSFNNALGELNTKGLIIRGSKIKANRDNLAAITEAVGAVKKQPYNIATFKDKLSKCEGEIYDILLANPRGKFSKESLAGKTPSSYSPTSSSFSNALGRLNTLELISRDKGVITLNPELLELL
ncbi:MAG TPA: hypothetical protein VGN00_14205 [Puia sp.]|jgi:hypothetical protein